MDRMNRIQQEDEGNRGDEIEVEVEKEEEKEKEREREGAPTCEEDSKRLCAELPHKSFQVNDD